MKYKSDNDEVYTYSILGEMYCFRYPNPVTRDNGKTFSEVAVAWKQGDENNSFTVPFFTKADDIGKTHDVIIKGIEEHIKDIRR